MQANSRDDDLSQSLFGVDYPLSPTTCKARSLVRSRSPESRPFYFCDADQKDLGSRRQTYLRTRPESCLNTNAVSLSDGPDNRIYESDCFCAVDAADKRQGLQKCAHSSRCSAGSPAHAEGGYCSFSLHGSGSSCSVSGISSGDEGVDERRLGRRFSRGHFGASTTHTQVHGDRRICDSAEREGSAVAARSLAARAAGALSLRC